MKERKISTTVEFRFDPTSPVQPQGFEGLGFDEAVTVVLKGKVNRIGISPWDKGKELALELESCEITKPAKTAVTSLDEALSSARKAGKRVT